MPDSICVNRDNSTLHIDPLLRRVGGQAARVSLTRTLLTHPGVLLADEVDAGLDEENADKVADILRKAADNGTAVVRIRHRKPDGRANRIMVLANGTISPLKTAQSAPSTHTEV